MNTLPAFPKPGQVKKKPIAVRVFRDGREVCNLLCKEGRNEYTRRMRVMWERQNHHCCLEGHIKECPGGYMRWPDATFEHEGGRGFGGSTCGGGFRDDRIEKLDPKTGKMVPINGVCHARCNIAKGSRKMTYNELVP